MKTESISVYINYTDAHFALVGAFINETARNQWLYERFSKSFPEHQFHRDSIVEEIEGIEDLWPEDGGFYCEEQECDLCLGHDEQIGDVSEVWVLVEYSEETSWTEATVSMAFTTREETIKGIIDVIKNDGSSFETEEEYKQYAERLVDSCQNPTNAELFNSDEAYNDELYLKVVRTPLIKE